jgi:DNA invertase Pin-like site-specific DNA recombinase
MRISCRPLGFGFTALTLANAAELERRLISERTRAALAVKKRELAKQGKRLGRPRAPPESIVRRVERERDSSATWQSIADRLNADGVPTTRGHRRRIRRLGILVTSAEGPPRTMLIPWSAINQLTWQ